LDEGVKGAGAVFLGFLFCEGEFGVRAVIIPDVFDLEGEEIGDPQACVDSEDEEEFVTGSVVGVGLENFTHGGDFFKVFDGIDFGHLKSPYL
jgi:hypothetical protein